jgi:hypothetical protein
MAGTRGSHVDMTWLFERSCTLTSRRLVGNHDVWEDDRIENVVKNIDKSSFLPPPDPVQIRATRARRAAFFGRIRQLREKNHVMRDQLGYSRRSCLQPHPTFAGNGSTRSENDRERVLRR